MNEEVMPVGTAARLKELEVANKALRFTLSIQGKSAMQEAIALRAEVERLRALNAKLLETLRHADSALALWQKQHETFYKDSRGDYSGMVRDRIAAIAKAEGKR